ncbi:hypothetical protein [Actinokineospora xionganensis]|uniref:Uncharacterized protein n=1 Tax=Actinokineospora xionganensis TaxID=2684470 RepID=A0ABR7L126_9PSEU|nr:hypothetical protein [Actinokineospora xionganensis]MBC6446292.1 hypothetical protein [Actinokineospora xionganensis]
MSARARTGARLFTVALLAGALVGPLISTVLEDQVNAPADVVTEAPDAAAAMFAAERQGSRVAVASERTPSKEVFANPGGTMTAEYTAVPTKVRRGNTWVPINTAMAKRADGSVGPVAAIGDLSVSGGGTEAPLLRIVKDRRSFALHWSGQLPTPVMSGDKATYPDVMPGVDLVVVAQRSGYQQHLVVKTADAARNPALAKITSLSSPPDCDWRPTKPVSCGRSTRTVRWCSSPRPR